MLIDSKLDHQHQVNICILADDKFWAKSETITWLKILLCCNMLIK